MIRSLTTKSHGDTVVERQRMIFWTSHWWMRRGFPEPKHQDRYYILYIIYYTLYIIYYILYIIYYILYIIYIHVLLIYRIFKGYMISLKSESFVLYNIYIYTVTPQEIFFSYLFRVVHPSWVLFFFQVKGGEGKYLFEPDPDTQLQPAGSEKFHRFLSKPMA